MDAYISGALIHRVDLCYRVHEAGVSRRHIRYIKLRRHKHRVLRQAAIHSETGCLVVNAGDKTAEHYIALHTETGIDIKVD